MRVIDRNAYERNKEAAHAENKFVFTCMNTDKICIFTDMGRMHSIKVVDIPLVRFRDKGTPVDILATDDSTQEQILYVRPCRDRLEAFQPSVCHKELPCASLWLEASLMFPREPLLPQSLGKRIALIFVATCR